MDGISHPFYIPHILPKDRSMQVNYPCISYVKILTLDISFVNWHLLPNFKLSKTTTIKFHPTGLFCVVYEFYYAPPHEPKQDSHPPSAELDVAHTSACRFHPKQPS